jgi:signal transduction histidine kinase
VALLNLIINARDAMPEGGRLKLTAHNQHLNATDGLAKSGTFVCIDLVDEGCGIPEDILDKVVEPFFTTKPVGKGSGLGLSKVKGFAEQSGGFLHILTKPGISTTVCVCLPAILEGPDLDTNNEPQMFLP